MTDIVSALGGVRQKPREKVAGFGNTPLNLPDRSEATQGRDEDLSASAISAQGSDPGATATPMGKTIQIHGDYLRYISWEPIGEDEFNDLLQVISGGYPWDIQTNGYFSLGKGIRGYANQAVMPQGIRVLFDKKYDGIKDEDTYECVIDFQGKYLGTFTPYNLFQLLLLLEDIKYRLKCSRFDIAIDDYYYKEMIHDCMDAIEKEQFVGFQTAKYITGDLVKKDDDGTLYLGSRRSDRFVRIYDAQAKHGIEAIRYELEAKGKVAREIVQNFLGEAMCYRNPHDEVWEKSTEEVEQLLGQFLGGVAVGHIDFVDKTNQRKNGQVSDLPRLPFWQDFIDRIGERLKISVYVPKATLAQTKGWMERQVSKPLAKIQKALGWRRFEDWLTGIINSGRKRFSQWDELQINEYANPTQYLDLEAVMYQ